MVMKTPPLWPTPDDAYEVRVEYRQIDTVYVLCQVQPYGDGLSILGTYGDYEEAHAKARELGVDSCRVLQAPLTYSSLQTLRNRVKELEQNLRLADAVKADIEQLVLARDGEIKTLCEALDKAWELLNAIAGVIKNGEQRMPVGAIGKDGVGRYLTASFIHKCADWCENEYTPHGIDVNREAMTDFNPFR